MRRIFVVLLALLAVGLVAGVALAPAHQNQDDRPVVASMTFDERMHPPTEVKDMLHTSCYNCHSNEGEHPFYEHLWPAAGLVQEDVRRGRARLNFSDWGDLSAEASRIRLMDACSMMREDKMPVWYYRPAHPLSSHVSATDMNSFCSWVHALPTTNDTAAVPTTAAGGQ